MKNTFSPFRRVAEAHVAMPQSTRPLSLTRTFVETGDERCPIAGIWSCLPGTDAVGDEPEIARPAMRILLSWRAFICISQPSCRVFPDTICF